MTGGAAGASLQACANHQNHEGFSPGVPTAIPRRALLVQRLHVADHLPDLLIGQLGPRRHALPHIPVYQ